MPAATAQEEPGLDAADGEPEDEAEQSSGVPTDPRSAPECPADKQVCLASLTQGLT